MQHTLSTHYQHTLFQHTPYQHTSYQHTPYPHTPFQHTLSAQSNTPLFHPLSHPSTPHLLPHTIESDMENNGFRSPRLTNTPEASARARRHWANAATTMQSNLYKAQKQNIHRNAAMNGDRNDEDNEEDDDEFVETVESRQNTRGNQRFNGVTSLQGGSNTNNNNNTTKGGGRDNRNNNLNSPSYVIDRRKHMGLSHGGVMMNSPNDTVMDTPQRSYHPIDIIPLYPSIISPHYVNPLYHPSPDVASA